MVTDDQYKKLVERIERLEDKYKRLSTQFMNLYLNNDAKSSRKTSTVSNDVVPKDITKFKFNGVIYCKRRLVLACIKEFLRCNPQLSYSNIKQIFPDYIQGSLGVIQSVDHAGKYSDAHRRFFFSDSDLIFINNEPYVVCCQWEKKNINRFLKVMKEQGFEIETININE